MGAFQSGFQMGQQGYQDAQDRAMRQRDLEMREAAAAQESQIRGLQIKAVTRAENQAQRSQDASTTYAGLVTSGTQTGNTSGMSDDSVRMIYTGAGGGAKGQQAVDDMASISNAENARFGLGAGQYKTSSTVAPDGQAATGLAPTVTTKAASPAELARARAIMFAVQQDWKGHEGALNDARKYDYDEGYVKHITAWNGMDDKAKAELIHKLSDDTGVRGYGTWVPGKGKQAGYMNYMAPGADPVKLSNKEAGQLYALTNLMQVDPGRARAEMDAVSDKVRAVAQSAFEAQTKGVTANNTATHDAAMDESSRVTAGAAAKNASTMASYRDEQITDLQDQRTRRQDMVDVQEQLDALDPKDPQFAQKVRVLQAKANTINVKNGGSLNFGRDSTGKGGSNSAAMKYQLDNYWLEASKKLRGDNVSPADIQGQKDTLYAEYGYAPQNEVDQIMRGRAKDGTKLTKEVVDEYNRHYPNSQIDPTELPWLKGKAAGSPAPAPSARAQPVDVGALQRGLVLPPVSGPSVMDRPVRQMGTSAGLIGLADAMPPDSPRMSIEDLRNIGSPRMLGLMNR